MRIALLIVLLLGLAVALSTGLWYFTAQSPPVQNGEMLRKIESGSTPPEVAPPLASAPPVAVNKERYKVVSALNHNSEEDLENRLNSMASEGWRVRTAIGNAVILAK